MNQRTARALLLGAALLASPIGCTSRAQKVVANVGPRTITVREMEETARKIDPSYFGSAPDSAARRHLLDDLVNKDLLALEAEDRHLADVDSIAKQVKITTSSVLLQELANDQIIRKVKVSDGDVRAAYDRLKDSLVAKHILVSTEDSARQIVALLQKGASFDSLAERLSHDRASAAEGGLLHFSFGDMVPEFEDAAYALKPGQTSKPVQSPFGWHVIRLVERANRSGVPKFDEIRDRLRETLKNRKQQQLTIAFLNDVKKRYAVTWTPGGVEKIDAILTAVRRAEGDTMPEFGMRKQKVGLAFPAQGIASREDSATVLVRSTGGKAYTVGEALVGLRQVPAFMRPSPGDTARIREFLEGEVLKPLLQTEAGRLGLAARDSVKKALQTKREEVLVTVLYQTEVERPGRATAAEGRAFYEAHPEYFQAKPRVSFYRITSQSKQRADSIYALVKAGKKLTAIGKSLGEDPFGMVGVANDQEVRDDPNDITARAAGMDVGQVSAPMEYPAASNSWVVFQVITKKPAGLYPYDEVASDAVRGASAEKQEARLRTLLERLKQKYPVTVHEDVLAQVRLPSRPKAGESTGAVGAPSGGSK